MFKDQVSQLWDVIFQGLVTADWSRAIPEFVGRLIPSLLLLFVGWIMYRRGVRRLQAGDSDEIVTNLHYFKDRQDGTRTMLLRMGAPDTSVNKLLDEVPHRKRLQHLATLTSVDDPILPTCQRGDFDLLNAMLKHAVAPYAVSPFPSEPWLFMATSEDRKIVRFKCIRIWLIKREDLLPMASLQWTITHIRPTSAWHVVRIIALHFAAKRYVAEEQEFRERPEGTNGFNDNLTRHRRIREVRIGARPNEFEEGKSISVDWASHIEDFQKLGISLPVVLEETEAQK